MNKKYQTIDSGNRIKFETGMVRDTGADKMRPDLCVPLDCKHPMLVRWAELMARGQAKYGERNWEKAATEEEYGRFRESAFRHFVQWFMGMDDEDHAAAVFFNVQGAEYVREKLTKDLAMVAGP